RARRLLVRVDGLGRRVETSTPLGAHHSRLPARPLFFQHPWQRDPLAAALAGRSSHRPCTRGGAWLLVSARDDSAPSSALLDQNPRAPRLALARTAQGPPSSRTLARSPSRQPNRMA